MAGVAGRSGGRNRKSAEQHVFEGTYQPSRHEAIALTPAAVRRLKQIQANSVFRSWVVRRLRKRLKVALRDGTPCEKLMGEERRQSQLQLQETGFLNAAERQLPATKEPNAFDRFLPNARTQ